MDKNVIKGYNGIMDLDLTNIDKSLHKSLIEQHIKDIELYKIEQSNLTESKRYENTIGYVNKKLEFENYMRSIKLYKSEYNQKDIDMKIIEISNIRKKLN